MALDGSIELVDRRKAAGSDGRHPGLTLEAPGSPRVLSRASSPDGRVLAATTVQGDILSWCLPELDAELSRLGLRG